MHAPSVIAASSNGAEQLRLDRFLFGSGERIDVREVRGSQAPIQESVRAIGEPLFVDLT